MGSSRKYYITVLLATFLIMTLALLGTGCTSMESNTGIDTGPETAEIEEPNNMQSRMPDGRRPGASGNGTMPERPNGRQFPMGWGNMDEVAEALGIETEVLEEAFADLPAQFPEGTPPMTPPSSTI